MIIFRTIPDNTGGQRGDMIECEIAGQLGRARVMSDGVEAAKQRAQAQARRKAAGVMILESLRGHS